MHYYGQTFGTFKKRFYGHQSDLRSQGKAKSTAFGKRGTRVRSQILNGGRSCPLCLHKDTYKLSNLSTSLSTCHHSPVQPHDVLLDPVQDNDAQPPFSLPQCSLMITCLPQSRLPMTTSLA
jgi:hypothetical protein